VSRVDCPRRRRPDALSSLLQELSAYKQVELPGRLEGEALQRHYSALLAKYLPAGPLRW